ncbi:MAG: response regulator [Povalibacter sp.]
MASSLLRTVLYVDDEPDIREIVEMSLGLIDGLNVHTRGSGESALADIASIAPDMLLIDVMMPGLDGPATVARLREQSRWARLPFVFMTAKAMPQEVARFKEIGAVDVIAKPFDPMDLGNRVVAIWKGLNHG